MALQQLYIIPCKRCRKSIQRLILQSRLSDPVLHESQCGFFSKGSIINKIFYPRLRGILPYMPRQVCTARQSMAHFYIVFLLCSLDCISQNSRRKCQRHDEQNQSLSVKTEPYWESNLMKVCVLLLKPYSSLPAHLEQGVSFRFGP